MPNNLPSVENAATRPGCVSVPSTWVSTHNGPQLGASVSQISLSAAAGLTQSSSNDVAAQVSAQTKRVSRRVNTWMIVLGLRDDCHAPVRISVGHARAGVLGTVRTCTFVVAKCGAASCETGGERRVSDHASWCPLATFAVRGSGCVGQKIGTSASFELSLRQSDDGIFAHWRENPKAANPHIVPGRTTAGTSSCNPMRVTLQVFDHSSFADAEISFLFLVGSRSGCRCVFSRYGYPVRQGCAFADDPYGCGPGSSRPAREPQTTIAWGRSTPPAGARR